MSAPATILYLQSNSEIGGSDVALLRLIEHLDKTRFTPIVVLPSDGALVEDFERHGCRVLIVPEMLKLTTRRGRSYWLQYLFNYPRAIWRLRQVIRGEGVALVHTNTLHNLYGFLAARLAGARHIWHVREIVWQSRAFRLLELWLAKQFAERVVVMSDAIGEMFRDSSGDLPANVVRIYDGIDVERFSPHVDAERVRADLNLALDAPLVGIACRLDYWKGVDTFLRAARVCQDEFPAARFVVVGGSVEGQEDYAAELARLAAELGIADVVTFTGWRYKPEDMPNVYAAMSVFVLASSQPEPFGLVLLEAMAIGKPVVATDHGGPREVCVQGGTALLVPPNDEQRMADAILTLLRDSELRRSFGAVGRRRVEEMFDQRRQVRALEALYDEVLNR